MWEPYKKTDDEYYYEMNGDSGHRWSIPMLLRTDPDYRRQYISAMKLKEKDIVAFNKMINWG